MTPNKDFESGGFPTKLGEYLATGKPVICTKVSEIPKYLNNTSAILIEPDNHSELVESLNKIIEHPRNYTTIGENGRLTVKKYFNTKTYLNELISFLNIANETSHP